MRIDFHIHSRYSFDCFLEPAQIIALAKQRGLDGLAVTDHDTMAGVEEFSRLAQGLIVIPGQEISTSQGDILGLFLKEEIKGNVSVDEAVRLIRQQGGLAVLAHPFKWPHLARSRAFLESFDAIEVFNARNNIPLPFCENRLAASAVRRHGLPFLAGSDVHEAFEVGMARTVFDFPASEYDEEGAKRAIRERRVRVEGREVPLAREIVSHFRRMIKGALR
jgi:hypothetical protein